MRDLAKTIGEIIDARLSRRTALKTLLLSSGLPLTRLVLAAVPEDQSTLRFAEIPSRIGERHAVAPGYSVDVLIRWGDQVLKDAPEFAPDRQSQFAQERQFGYNNDYVGYFPLPRGSTNSEHGLLCVNHEYTSSHLLFPGDEGNARREHSEQSLSPIMNP